jgi:hypothetical protein
MSMNKTQAILTFIYSRTDASTSILYGLEPIFHNGFCTTYRLYFHSYRGRDSCGFLGSLGCSV